MTNASAADRLRDGLAALRRPTGPLPRPTRRDLILDGAFALFAVIAAVNSGLSVGMDRTYKIVDGTVRLVEGSGNYVGALAPMLLCSLPLALRRRYPLAVLWVVIAAGLVAPGSEARMILYATLVATYSAVMHSPYRIPTLASVAVALLVLNGARTPDVPTIQNEYVPLLILLPLTIVADGMRQWRLRADARQERMAALERERAEELRRAAERERARIARELHDVVTHNVSMMVIQAGAARKVMDAEPEMAREALLAVEAGGRSAMAELRHTMGLLTMNAADDPSDPTVPAGRTAPAEGLAPQPGLDQLDALVGRVREAGLSVEMTATGTRRQVSSGIGLAVYRVVQEALTNTTKHARGARATVTLAYEPDALRIDVTDTGGTPGADAAGGGHGLMGLRERISVYGGTLDAGPRPDGGFRIAATIPLEAL
ncbi:MULTISPECIES: sensor histidine kinase [unclassified Streptomyces]|uniref:sensor histidine kinase n=1 Tax=unclassified Streptomyces TaxID=2593676 RepID=UPI002E191005|nr:MULTISPECIES: histidine kinase [unclassified Streptomyces]